MTENKKLRIEIRYDEITDKDMIDFIDKNGSTRAGFIKQVLLMYKNQIESMTLTTFNSPVSETKEEKKNLEEKKSKRKINDISYSSNDLE